MKTFALIWTVIFLLSVIPAMRLDHRRKVRRLWANLHRGLRELTEAFIALGPRVKQADASIRGFIEEWQVKENA